MAQRRSKEEIEQLLEQYRTSGLTQIEYCQQTGIVLSSLGRYLRQRKGAGAEPQLVRIKVDAESPSGGGFTLVLGNGRRIESDWGFAEAELGRLIRVAEGA